MSPKFPHQEFLEETLHLAGAELRRRFRSQTPDQDLQVREKSDSSLVTLADLASEEIVLGRIRQHFPDDLIYSEEAGLSSTTRTPGKGIWVVDPLDGTTNFSNGYEYFCVSIARGFFTEDGRIEVTFGGVYDPCRDRSYVAGRGAGAFCNGTRLTVLPGRPLKSSFLVTGFYYQKGDKLSREMARFHRVAEVCSSIRRDGAAALDLALVAAGIFDAFWEMGLQPWDVAAGSLLVEEAGGFVTDYGADLSQPFNLENPGVIAGNRTAVLAIGELL